MEPHAAEIDLRYPIGRHTTMEPTPEQRVQFIETIASTPARMREAVAGLTEEQIETPYRPGGWTVREVVHHVPDSHVNSYCRFKFALTENAPRIMTYEEAAWAALPDSRAPVEISLALLEALHARWTYLLREMTDEDFARKLDHPEWGHLTLGNMLGLYDWHCRHHVAHVTSLRERMGW